MRLILPAILAALLPVAAPAQDGFEQQADTPSGPLSVSVDEEAFVASVTVGAETFTFPEVQYAFIAERVGDVFLIELSPGGNACAGNFAWLDTTPGQVRMTEPFGTCSDLFEISYDDQTITVTLPSMQPGEGSIAFVWDGAGPVREVPLGLPASGIPPGSDPVAWIDQDRHPYDLVNSADWEPVLTELVGGEMLATLRETMQLSDGFHRRGDWVVGIGTNKFSLDRAGVALGPGGRLLVAFQPADGETRIWGDRSAGVPEGFADLSAE